MSKNSIVTRLGLVGESEGATFSECDSYRYSLWRTWDSWLPKCNFLMLNPSTADETILDPTVTRCMNYAKAWGFGGLVVTNLFAFRSTDPAALKTAADPIGPDNDEAIEREALRCPMTVCAWGNHGALHSRDSHVRLKLACNPFIKLRCLKINVATKQPAHPLYLSRDLKPIAFPK